MPVIWEPNLSPQAQGYKDLAEKLTAEHFEPLVEELDRDQRYPWENVKVLNESGLSRMFLPKELGGADATLTDANVVVETIAKGCPSTAAIVTTYQLGAYIIQQVGTPEQKERYLKNGVSKGDCVSFCLSERGAGSDPAGMETLAMREGDGWRIRGEKYWVGNGTASPYYVVFAKTDPSAGARGITGFMVHKDAPGVTFDYMADKMGQRGSYTSNIKLDTVVKEDAIVGEMNRGLKTALVGLNLGRITISGHALGMAMAAFEEAAKRACERNTFGKPLIDHQAIGYKLADMATEISAARALVYEATRAFDNGQDISSIAAMCKIIATEVTNRVANEAVQIWGSQGYVKPNKVERIYRDVRINQIYEGASEIQRIVLTRAIRSAFMGRNH
jgi:alkylation response protein AidB-like acyl-CoA dehydrogenase